MGLGRERAERHGGGGETTENRFNGLDLFDGDRPGRCGDEFQQVFNGDGIGVQRNPDVFLVIFRFAGFDEGVEVLDDVGGECVALAGLAVAVVARIAEVKDASGGGFGLEGGAMTDEGFLGDFTEADATDFR